MRRILNVFLFVLFSGFLVSAQDFSSLWDSHYSYFNITDVTRSNDKIFAASENAIFSFDPASNEIEKITTVEGLSGDTISTLEYILDYELLLIGYNSGLIEIFFTDDNSVLSVVDILEKDTISSSNKRINDFFEYQGLVYISTNFGVSIYNMDRLEFGDSYFLGNGGAQIEVKKTAVFNNAIYAACGNGNGLKKGLLSNENLVDFSQWETIASGDFVSVETFGDKTYAIAQNRDFLEIVGNDLVTIGAFNTLPRDTEISENTLIVTELQKISLFDPNANIIVEVSDIEDFQTRFSSCELLGNKLYIGSADFGVLEINYINQDASFQIRPDGPLNNNAFKIHSEFDKLWVAFGDYDRDFNPYPQRFMGLSKFINDEWINTPKDSLLGARELVGIAVNPFNPNQTFIASFLDGILEFQNNEPEFLFDENNSGLESDYPNEIRVGDVSFDRNGMLWSITSRVRRPVKSFDVSTGQWRAYDIDNVVPDAGVIGSGVDDGELGYGDLQIDSNGTKWFGSFRNGLIGFNEGIDGGISNSASREDQNMPSPHVYALAVDQRNQVWIGTAFGLRVLFNTAGFLENPNPSVNEIVILEDGIPKELLESQFITDIKVDGSNNKWIGTFDSGVFYFSSDGQTTIYHFTKDNSPLPSNTINDISISEGNGRVFFATDKGLLSFKAGGSNALESLDTTHVYPNPVRPEYGILGFDNLNDINKGVKIKGLTENVNVKITDIEGNLVAEAQSRINLRSSKANYNFAIDGGTGVWNGKNLRGNIVASGVYLIFISDLDSLETKTLKLLIVR